MIIIFIFKKIARVPPTKSVSKRCIWGLASKNSLPVFFQNIFRFYLNFYIIIDQSHFTCSHTGQVDDQKTVRLLKCQRMPDISVWDTPGWVVGLGDGGMIRGRAVRQQFRCCVKFQTPMIMSFRVGIFHRLLMYTSMETCGHHSFLVIEYIYCIGCG